VAKLADAPDLGSGAARRGGSSPSTRTILKTIDFIVGVFVVGAPLGQSFVFLRIVWGLFLCADKHIGAKRLMLAKHWRNSNAFKPSLLPNRGLALCRAPGRLPSSGSLSVNLCLGGRPSRLIFPDLGRALGCDVSTDKLKASKE